MNTLIESTEIRHLELHLIAGDAYYFDHESFLCVSAVKHFTPLHYKLRLSVSEDPFPEAQLAQIDQNGNGGFTIHAGGRSYDGLLLTLNEYIEEHFPNSDCVYFKFEKINEP